MEIAEITSSRFRALTPATYTQLDMPAKLGVGAIFRGRREKAWYNLKVTGYEIDDVVDAIEATFADPHRGVIGKLFISGSYIVASRNGSLHPRVYQNQATSSTPTYGAIALRNLASVG